MKRILNPQRNPKDNKRKEMELRLACSETRMSEMKSKSSKQFGVGVNVGVRVGARVYVGRCCD